uniref:Nucleoside diphosphate kinase n=1 Tax=Cyanistes caeruleus TaxID=156563 RepID=A0A8C0U6Y0_CYACU
PHPHGESPLAASPAAKCGSDGGCAGAFVRPGFLPGTWLSPLTKNRILLQRFNAKILFKFALLKASEELLKQHYIDLKDRPFFPGLVKYMKSGPIVAMVWEGLNVVKTGRVMLGETNPADSKPGTIRGDFCIQVGRNIIHGSDSVESAQKEINLWFKPTELIDFKPCAHDWIYE